MLPYKLKISADGNKRSIDCLSLLNGYLTIKQIHQLRHSLSRVPEGLGHHPVGRPETVPTNDARPLADAHTAVPFYNFCFHVRCDFVKLCTLCKCFCKIPTTGKMPTSTRGAIRRQSYRSEAKLKISVIHEYIPP